MEIVGNGFIARNLSETLGAAYPDVTVLAAGVSGTGFGGTGGKTAADVTASLDREATLVYDAVRSCARSGRTVVFLSTASHAMYGPGQGAEDGPVCPPLVYGRHKLSLEAVLRASEVDWLTLRLAHIVGAAQPPHLIWPALNAQVRSGSVTLYRDARRDLLDVRDLITALDGLLAAGVRREVVNVATGTQYRVESVVDGIEDRLGIRAERTTVDMPGSGSTIATAKLRSLVPEWAGIDFGQSYLDKLLDEYVRCYDTPAPARLLGA